MNLTRTPTAPSSFPMPGTQETALLESSPNPSASIPKAGGFRLIARTQQHIEAMIDGANPRHPVIVVDDAQRLENDSLWDLCSLLFQTAKPTAAASLLLVGDETLAKRLDLRILAPIRSRLTGIIKTQFMNENETRLFIEHRLKNADASPVLFDKDAVEIIAAFTRGNRRTLMNTATMALEEAYYLEEKNHLRQYVLQLGMVQRIRVKRRRTRGDSAAKG